jgi:hypothetical protein
LKRENSLKIAPCVKNIKIYHLLENIKMAAGIA